MFLALYRRHRRDCKAGHAEELRTTEYDERKKGWKRCECPILVSGTLQGQSKRKNTGRWEWDEARSVAAHFEKLGNWDEQVPPAPPAAKVETGPERITLDRAIKSFMAEFEGHAAPNTQKKYRLLLSKLRAFADSRGYVMIDQWTPIDVREMRSSWTVSPRSAVKDMSTVKSFFEYCLANEWIPRNPARLVKNPRTRDAADRRGEQKLPFSDSELSRMYRSLRNGLWQAGGGMVPDDSSPSRHRRIHPLQQQVDGAGLGRFHIGVRLYRAAYFGRLYV